MTEALPVNSIENALRLKSTRRGDGSFDIELERAEEDLKKRHSSPIPIEKLMNLFGILPLNFNFNAEKLDASIEKMRSDEKVLEKSNTTKETQAAKQQPREREFNPAKAVNDTKALKEALIKFTPNPVVPIFVPFLSAANPQSLRAVSKIDIQLLIDQIVEQAKLLKTQKKVELQLLLKELDLGEMNLLFTKSGGLVSIQITASAETKKNLESHMNNLEAALKLANIEIKELKIVEVSNEQLFPGS